ncbi:MAG: molecular chaperone DnaJ [Clostridiales bacterium]|nr:molecular chaperone DnaJ [Clostridiales bacterium]
MPEKRDYYEVLGVDRSASDEDIKKAFRRLAKECHPDLHAGDKEAEARFKEVNEAYEVLSDPQHRSQYDQFGHAGPQGFGGFGGFQGGFGGFEDIFESFFGGDIFGGRRGRTGPQRGRDVEVNLRITFEEAAFGAKKSVTVNRQEHCETCGGSGAKTGTRRETCSQCRGTGQVRQVRQTILGQTVTSSPCPACSGTGSVVKEPCADCRGTGRVMRQRTISLDVPPGIDDGQSISLRGQGEAGYREGPSGDLLVHIAVQPHKLFVRDGYSVKCEVPITFTQAALGAEIEVPTLDGRVRYEIPEGTQTGTVFRLRNRGVQKLHSTDRGDMYIRVNVEIPQRLTRAQKDILRKFEQAASGREYKDQRSFIDKVKELLG